MEAHFAAKMQGDGLFPAAFHDGALVVAHPPCVFLGGEAAAKRAEERGVYGTGFVNKEHAYGPVVGVVVHHNADVSGFARREVGGKLYEVPGSHSSAPTKLRVGWLASTSP